MIWVALTMVVGQGAIIGTLLYFVRTFGAYTEALLRAHESNVMMHQYTLKVLETVQWKTEELHRARRAAGEVA